jgi:peptidylprolyl isomerase
VAARCILWYSLTVMRTAIVVIVIILLLIGGVWLLFGTSKKADNTSSANTSSAKTSNPTITMKEPALSTNTTPDGLKIEVIKKGSGPQVKSGDTVSIDYIGELQDGSVFDSSYKRGTPFETQIGVGQVIKGWDEGVVGMQVGEERRLTIPPELGYGATGAGSSIPPNATLLFDVTLRGIK